MAVGNLSDSKIEMDDNDDYYTTLSDILEDVESDGLNVTEATQVDTNKRPIDKRDK
jgi:hypothetical protein